MSSTASLEDPEKDAISPTVAWRGRNHGHQVYLSQVDIAAELVAGKDLDMVDEAEAKRVL